jgi:hypothetical protein
VQGSAIGLAEDGRTPYPEFTASARDARRDFPAIGDEYFLEHGRDPFAFTPGKILARRFLPPLDWRGFTVESSRIIFLEATRGG